MVVWTGILHPAWNAAAGLIWLLSVIAVCRVPTERFAHGWRTKIFWVLVATAVAWYSDGFDVPVGAFIGFRAARYHRRVLAGPPPLNA